MSNLIRPYHFADLLPPITLVYLYCISIIISYEALNQLSVCVTKVYWDWQKIMNCYSMKNFLSWLSTQELVVGVCTDCILEINCCLCLSVYYDMSLEGWKTSFERLKRFDFMHITPSICYAFHHHHHASVLLTGLGLLWITSAETSVQQSETNKITFPFYVRKWPLN